MGLSARPELNGRIGVATGYVPAKGRWQVALDGGADGGPPLGLRPANLDLMWNPNCENCSICLESLEMVSSPNQGLPCSHTVHSECADFVLENGGEDICPVCRRAPAGCRPLQWLVDEALTVLVQSNSKALDKGKVDALAAYSLLLLHEASEISTDDANSIFNLGQALEQSGDEERALKAYRNAIALNPSDANYLCAMGALLGEVGDIKGACDAYREATTANPKDADAFCSLGTLLGKSGDAVGSIAAFRDACDASPTDADAHGSLGLMLYQTQEYEESIAAFRRAIELESANPEYHCGLGAAFRDSGLVDQAMAAFKAALDVDPACETALRQIKLHATARRTRPETDA